MVAVETVRGPVEVDALGVTLMHEHVFVLTPDVLQNYGDQYWDEEERVADAIAKLTRLKELGCDQFAGYLQHDNKEETLRVYGETVIPALSDHITAKA